MMLFQVTQTHSPAYFYSPSLEMKMKLWHILMAILQATSWVCEASRPFSNAAQGLTAQPIISPDWKAEQGLEKVDKATIRGFGSIGSRPPSCNHKCGGCVPCVAVQVPANSGPYGLQYANYRPEGWKCKCGALVYNP